MDHYIESYRRYCWPVRSLNDFKLAPFHILASEGKVHSSQTHSWHMDTLARLCAADPKLLLATPFKLVDVTNPESETVGVKWWEELTWRGGELDQLRALQPLLESRLTIITNNSREDYEWTVNSDSDDRRVFRLLGKFDRKLIYSGSMQDIQSRTPEDWIRQLEFEAARPH